QGLGGPANSQYWGSGAPAATVTTSTFSGNDWEGMLSEVASLTLVRSTVAGNGGWGLWCSGTTTIDSCTLRENGSGGVSATGSLALVNSTIAMNSGPGLFLSESGLGSLSVSIVGCTIARNTVYTTATAGTTTRGGGIDVHPFSGFTGPTVQLRNT